MRCSISGEETTEPVVSPKSGSIFERKHIVNYVQANGKDPINDEPLTIEELVQIKNEANVIVPPQQSSATSIPAMLSNFQNEWDALALEVFTLRKQLFTAREELSSALYQYDAAVRVAARSIKERDDAREALRELSLAIANGSGPDSTVDGGELNGITTVGIPVEELNEAKAHLFELHKAQKLSNPLGTSKNVTLATVKSEPKDQKIQNSKTIISNGTIVSYSESSLNINQYDDDENTSTINKLLSSTVNACDISANNKLITVHDDSICFEAHSTKIDGKHIFEIKCHPLLPDLFVGLSSNRWGLYDCERGLLFQSPASTNSYTTISFHVDGLLIAVGTETSQIEIYSLADGNLASSFNTKHLKVKKIQFGLNGYWMALLSESTIQEESKVSSLEVFDLRKNVSIHTINSDKEILDFTLDASSSLIATVSNSVSLYSYIKKGKKWTTIEVENAPSDLQLILFDSRTPLKLLGSTGTELLEFMLEATS
ncbi:uncharacterized protein KQ657_000281 [Scheffersomyces spartinae]|uniref:Pre-mRNA-processing factor 19 n=1 Tax=Scheffersomyces spartinae TaxID=45513 RepID=A0A9P7VE26_9ASCO|nr:uncharacterized protein KQ657_000281 [Scheffersomyces spartinae]KAG7196266.1 hypothetical protein KQ657_000281 [Scheffersomyces spartinae]